MITCMEGEAKCTCWGRKGDGGEREITCRGQLKSGQFKEEKGKWVWTEVETEEEIQRRKRGEKKITRNRK